MFWNNVCIPKSLENSSYSIAAGIFVHFTIFQCVGVGVNGENTLLIIKILLQLCFRMSLFIVNYSQHNESPQQDL